MSKTQSTERPGATPSPPSVPSEDDEAKAKGGPSGDDRQETETAAGRYEGNAPAQQKVK